MKQKNISRPVGAELIVKMKNVAVRGPLLCETDERGAAKPGGFFVPAPADCVCYDAQLEDPQKGLICRRLAPQAASEDGVFSDLDTQADREQTLSLLVEKDHDGTQYEKKKRTAQGPAFWCWERFEKWLCDPDEQTTQAMQPMKPMKEEALGIPPLVREQRLHVGIEKDTRTAQEGVLFATETQRFVSKKKGGGFRHLGLFFSCEVEQELEQAVDKGLAGIVTLGGGGKQTFLEKAVGQSAFPKVPAGLVEKLKEAKRARVFLLTPALFQEGFAPKQIGKAKVVAAAVQRPAYLSGWDMERVRTPDGNMRQKGHKPSRKMALPGSVYFVKFPSDLPDLEVETWLDSVWMKCLQNQMTGQDQKDGFGLCAVGVG